MNRILCLPIILSLFPTILGSLSCNVSKPKEELTSDPKEGVHVIVKSAEDVRNKCNGISIDRALSIAKEEYCGASKLPEHTSIAVWGEGDNYIINFSTIIRPFQPGGTLNCKIIIRAATGKVIKHIPSDS